jgi:putative membrane protein
VVLPAFIAAFHHLALALGLGGVFARGLALRQLRRQPQDAGALSALFRADGAWGAAAALWLATGLVRAFAGLEKAAGFYLRNGFFYTKMGLFLLILLLELYPMITFIRWRIARGKGAAPVAVGSLASLIRMNDLELAVVLLIPFAATLMARGLWLF